MKNLLITALLIAAFASNADAWIYPEHRGITALAIQKLDPARRAELEQFWTLVRKGHESRLFATTVEFDHFTALPSLTKFKKTLCAGVAARKSATEIRRTQAAAICRGETIAIGVFKFAKSGFCPPGGSGTQRLENKKIIVSAAGRVRVE